MAKVRWYTVYGATTTTAGVWKRPLTLSSNKAKNAWSFTFSHITFIPTAECRNFLILQQMAYKGNRQLSIEIHIVQNTWSIHAPNLSVFRNLVLEIYVFKYWTYNDTSTARTPYWKWPKHYNLSSIKVKICNKMTLWYLLIYFKFIHTFHFSFSHLKWSV
jgi:hypothetical protein